MCTYIYSIFHHQSSHLILWINHADDGHINNLFFLNMQTYKATCVSSKSEKTKIQKWAPKFLLRTSHINDRCSKPLDHCGDPSPFKFYVWSGEGKTCACMSNANKMQAATFNFTIKFRTLSLPDLPYRNWFYLICTTSREYTALVFQYLPALYWRCFNGLFLQSLTTVYPKLLFIEANNMNYEFRLKSKCKLESIARNIFSKSILITKQLETKQLSDYS